MIQSISFAAVQSTTVQSLTRTVAKRELNQEELMRDFNQIFPNVNAAKDFGAKLVNAIRDHVKDLTSEIETKATAPVDQARELVRRMRDSWTAWFENALQQFEEVFIY